MNIQDRKLGIGGSECAAVMGLSKWKSPYQVWLDKTNIDSAGKEDNDAMWFGRELEPIILKRYQEKSGNKVELLVDDNGEQKTIVNPKYPWLMAHVDGVVKDKKLIVEAKTTRYFLQDNWGEEGTDNVPVEYIIQCAHYCVVLNDLFDIEGVDIAALGSTSDFRIYHYKRNEALEKQIINQTHKFWVNHVQKIIPPEATTQDDLNKIYSVSRESPIIATSEINKKCEDLLLINSQISKYKELKEQFESELKLFMKDNSELIDVSGKVLASWKTSKAKTLDQTKLKQSGLDLSSYYSDTTKRTFLIKK